MLEQSANLANCLESSVNDDLFGSLIDVLTRELAVYRELKDFLASEREILMHKAVIMQINKNNAVKENIILKARILGEARTNVLKKIARNFDIDDRTVKLMSLANYAVIEKRQIIEKLKNDLLVIATEISVMNNDNKYILEASLNNVKVSLDFVSSLLDRSGVYLGNGKIGEVKKKGRLLRTEG